MNNEGQPIQASGVATIEEIHAFLGPDWDVREFRGPDVRQTYPPPPSSETDEQLQSAPAKETL